MNQAPKKNRERPLASPPAIAEEPSLLAPVKALWLGTCARYTVLTLVALLVNALISESLTKTYVDTIHFFLFLPFSLCLTLAALVRRSDKLSKGWRVLLHPLLFFGGFYLCLYLPYQIETRPTGGQVLIILTLVLLLYATAMGIYLLATSKQRRKKEEETPYKSLFGPKA